MTEIRGVHESIRYSRPCCTFRCTITYCNPTTSFNFIFLDRLLLYTAGVKLTTSIALCSSPALCKRAICENLCKSVIRDQCQTGLSCLPLASFQLAFTFSFPLGLLISVKKATYVQVWRCLARWKIWYQFVVLTMSVVCSLGRLCSQKYKPITHIFD